MMLQHKHDYDKHKDEENNVEFTDAAVDNDDDDEDD